MTYYLNLPINGKLNFSDFNNEYYMNIYLQN